MSISIGGIDPVRGVVDLELRVGTLEKLLEAVLNNPNTAKNVNINDLRNAAFKDVQSKYPQLGLQLA